MNFYNMIYGVSSSTFFFLPFLGKHPDEYPRFRDCYTNDPERPEYKDKIIIYTRTGGGNRDGYIKENNEMCAMETYITNYDDDFDSTYACWVFDIPEKWKKDYKKLLSNELTQISKEYVNLVISIYPKLEDKIRKTFHCIS